MAWTERETDFLYDALPDLPLEYIAEILDRSVDTVRAKIYRDRKKRASCKGPGGQKVVRRRVNGFIMELKDGHWSQVKS